MSDFSELLQTIKKAAKEAVDSSNPCGILFGTVISTNPLQINVEQKMTLDRQFLILTKNVIDYEVDVSMNWDTNSKSLNANHNHSVTGDISINSNATISPNENNAKITITNETQSNLSIEQKNINLSHSHKVEGTKKLTIHNALNNGDKVILIQIQGGQKYVVLDKVY